MSKPYEQFKSETIKAQAAIKYAKAMRAVSDEFASGFAVAMWEAREIFMRLEDNYTIEPIGTENRGDHAE